MWPPTLQSIVEFVAHLSAQGVAPSTVKSYLSGVSFKCKMDGHIDVTQFFLIKKMLNGMSRLTERVDSRLPITPDLLFKIVRILPVVCHTSYEAVLFSAIFTLAFYAFLRVGELVVTKQGVAGHALLAHNVEVCDREKTLKIKLPHSKTDQEGKGVVLIVQRNGSGICPFHFIKLFLALRSQVPGVFFCHIGNNPVTRYQFSAVLSKSLRAIGVSTNRYKSHSFRVGAATLASMKGFTEEKIKELGRWESRAFKTYIRIPTDKLI